MNMTKWRNWQTHDAQNVGPGTDAKRWSAWEFESPLGHIGLQARQVPNWPP